MEQSPACSEFVTDTCHINPIPRTLPPPFLTSITRSRLDLLCPACSISAASRATVLSPGAAPARTASAAAPLLTVPASAAAPGALGTGRLSPVSMDSSTVLLPSTTVPSTGTLSPGLTSTRSPG